jgi:hypothetical protein
MTHYILILLEYTLPGLVVAAFVVWFLWKRTLRVPNKTY